MPEQLTIPETPQYHKNIDLLRQSQFGHVLEKAYEAVLDLEPRLMDVNLVDDNRTEAVPSWRQADDVRQHKVYFPVANPDVAARFPVTAVNYINEMEIERSAGIMTTPVERLTPEMRAVAAFMHELGHTAQFLEFEDNPQDFETMFKEDRAEWPIPDTLFTELSTTIGRQKIAEHRDRLSGLEDDQGRIAFSDVKTAQYMAYRDSSTEQYADSFAAFAVATHPELRNPDTYTSEATSES